ncbi:hypothetical protein REH65_08995 [Saccharopolyspora sp. ID03-671]|uniref:hypothetical protein n=1 Tax=Saccharopolyspora sp. ID03-671 TaxID=3073066 RepID=UPI00324EC187
MTEDAEPATETHFDAEVTDSSIHTGTGHIFHLYDSGYESVMSRLRGPRLTFKGDLGWSERRFVAPPGLDAAHEALRRNGTVFLTGPAGSGRSTAAKILVNMGAGDASPYSLLTDEPYELSRHLHAVELLADHRLVLDLLDSGEEVFRARLRELPEFRTRLVSAGAHLVVVVPDEFVPLLGDELRQFTERIGRPAGERVLRSHLKAEGLHRTGDQLSPDRVSSALELPMSEIAALAGRIVAISRQAPGVRVDDLLAEALSQRADRRAEVSKLVEQRPGGRERAILLASALCHGASGDAVFFAAHRLVELMELDASEPPRLEQSGYRTQLDELGIDLVTPNRIDLGKWDFDRALLEHFWDNYPDLRRTFCSWVDEVIRMEPLTGADRIDLVDRFTAQALRTGSPGHVVWLIERWMERHNHRSRPLRDFAVQALTNGLEDHRYGRRFRRLIYDWATDPELPDEVGQILVTLTANLIAPDYPAQAVVRLHHRSRRERGSPLAQEALLNLVADNDFLLLHLLQRLERGLGREHPWDVDFALFARLAEPNRLTDVSRVSRPLAARPEARSGLVAGWRALFAHRLDYADHLLGQWLATAGRVSNADLLLTIPVEAAKSSVRLLGRLYVIGQDWSRTEHGHPHVAIRLAQLIDRAQGVQNQDYAYPRPEEFVL